MKAFPFGERAVFFYETILVICLVDLKSSVNKDNHQLTKALSDGENLKIPVTRTWSFQDV